MDLRDHAFELLLCRCVLFKRCAILDLVELLHPIVRRLEICNIIILEDSEFLLELVSEVLSSENTDKFLDLSFDRHGVGASVFSELRCDGIAVKWVHLDSIEAVGGLENVFALSFVEEETASFLSKYGLCNGNESVINLNLKVVAVYLLSSSSVFLNTSWKSSAERYERTSRRPE